MKKKKRFNPGGLKFRNEMLALALLAPTIALFVLFKYYPIISGVFISFFKINIVKLPGDFCGFDNYIRAFKDARFYAALFNNLKHFAYIMAMNFWCPILLAILVDETKKSKGIFRLLYFIPSVAPAIVMTLLWKYFWQPDYGLANFLIGKLGVPPQLWLNDKALVYFCMYFPNLVIVGGMQLVSFAFSSNSFSNAACLLSCGIAGYPPGALRGRIDGWRGCMAESKVCYSPGNKKYNIYILPPADNKQL